MLLDELWKTCTMYEAKDPVKTGSITIILVWAWLLAELADTLGSLFTIHALGGFGGGIVEPTQLQLADRLNQGTAIANFVMLVVTGIATLRWISLTNRNAQTWSDQVEITPGWAMGWFFVPVANLFKPFEGVGATWRATVALDIRSVDVPVILRWWWGLWLAASIWGNIIFRLSIHADTPEQLITAHWATVANLLIDLPLAFVLTRVIAQLSAMQSQVLASSVSPIHTDDDPI